MSTMEIIYVTITLREATKPNSNKMVVWVKQKTANPMAVVRLAKNSVTLIFSNAVSNALNLLPYLAYSRWYLLIIRIQLGTPITIIRGGINPVKTVIR